MIIPSLRNRVIYHAAMYGVMLKDIAPLFGITPGRVSQIYRSVRRYYDRRAAL